MTLPHPDSSPPWPDEESEWDEWRANDNRQRVRDLHIESRAEAWRETSE